MDFMKEVITQNPHWQTGVIDFPRVDNKLITREIFSNLESSIKRKFIIILRGLRRTGKSVMARQLLQNLLKKGMKPTEIGWFEFDRSMNARPEDLDSLISFFKNRNVKLIVFDEIAFVSGWQDVIKKHYDLTDIKFVVTGSSALEFDKRSSESLVGRYKLIKVNPFSFLEYLLLKDCKIPRTELEFATLDQELIMNCDEYIRYGGLPETILLNQKEKNDYIRQSVLDPIFFKDMPVVFPSANPDLLSKILELSTGTVGSPFQFQTIAQVIGCSHPTISHHIEALTRAMLINVLFNYTSSTIKQKRTAKKVVISDNGLLSILNPSVSIGALAENAVAINTNTGNFWRDSEGREVDFIIPEKKLAIEVKYQEHITTSDEKNLRYFLEKNRKWQGILITKKEESKGDIKHIPLWKWLLNSSALPTEHKTKYYKP